MAGVNSQAYLLGVSDPPPAYPAEYRCSCHEGEKDECVVINFVGRGGWVNKH